MQNKTLLTPISKVIAEKINQLFIKDELNFTEINYWYNYDNLISFGDDLLLDGYAGEENRPYAPYYVDLIDSILNYLKSIDVYIETEYAVINNESIYIKIYENPKVIIFDEHSFDIDEVIIKLFDFINNKYK